MTDHLPSHYLQQSFFLTKSDLKSLNIDRSRFISVKVTPFSDGHRYRFMGDCCIVFGKFLSPPQPIFNYPANYRSSAYKASCLNGTSDIKLQLVNVNELLRSPVSLYRKRILRNDAEEFLVEEAEALPRKTKISMKVQLGISEAHFKEEIPGAIHSHFRYRREQSQKEYKRILQYGWRILFIALALLALIFLLTEVTLHLLPENRLVLFIRESFIIFGWVALWRPMELLLYDWYPIKSKIRLYKRLEESDVQVTVDRGEFF